MSKHLYNQQPWKTFQPCFSSLITIDHYIHHSKKSQSAAPDGTCFTKKTESVSSSTQSLVLKFNQFSKSLCALQRTSTVDEIYIYKVFVTLQNFTSFPKFLQKGKNSVLEHFTCRLNIRDFPKLVQNGQSVIVLQTSDQVSAIVEWHNLLKLYSSLQSYWSLQSVHKVYKDFSQSEKVRMRLCKRKLEPNWSSCLRLHDMRSCAWLTIMVPLPFHFYQ